MSSALPSPALRKLNVEPGHLSPPLMPRCSAYAVFVPQQAQAIVLTCDAGDGQVIVNGVPVAPNKASEPICVQVGRTEIHLLVTAADGRATRKYILTVHRPQAVPTWNCVAKANPWPARDSAGELVFADHVWLFGGYTPTVINDVWRSPDGIRWEPMPPLPDDSGVNVPIRFVLHDQMWITTNGSGYFRSRDGSTWEAVPGAMPWSGRRNVGCVVFHDRVWILGGESKGGKRHNDVWSSADGVNWRMELAEAPWSRRSLHDNVLVHDDSLWIVGGCIQNYHPWKAYRDVWQSADGIHWERATEEAPWAGRSWASCVVYRNRIWVLGGFRSEPQWENFNDVWYSADGVTWHPLTTPDIWSPRHEISPYVFKERLWVCGGNAWPLMNDAWHLEITGLTFLTQPVIEEYAQAAYVYSARADFNQSRRPIKYRLLEAPDWITLDPSRGRLSGTPPCPGDSPVVLEAFDDAGESAKQSFTIHVRQ